MIPERRARTQALKLVVGLAREIADDLHTYPLEPKSHKWTHIGLRGTVCGSTTQLRESLAAGLIVHGWNRDAVDQRLFTSDSGVELLVLQHGALTHEALIRGMHEAFEVVPLHFGAKEFKEDDIYARKIMQGGRWIRPRGDAFLGYLRATIPAEYQDRLKDAVV